MIKNSNTAGFIFGYHGGLELALKIYGGDINRINEFFLIEKYSKKYDKVFVFSCDKKKYSHILPKNAIHIIIKNKLFYILFGWIVIAHYAKKYKIQHLRAIRSPVLPNVFMVNKLTNTKILMDYNYLWHAIYKEDRRDDSFYEILKKNKVMALIVLILEKFLVNFVDYFIVGDPAVEKYIKDKSKILPIKKAIRTDGFNKSIKLHKIYEKIRGPSIVFVGRIVPMKDPMTLIKAYKIAKKTIPDLNLIICGDGPLMQECKKISDNGVHYLGRISNVAGVLKKADIYICSSRYDPSPKSLMEAMAMGIPCIATNTGGVSYYMNNSCGILIEPKNPEIMAEKIIYLLKHKEIAKELGRKAKQRIYEEYDLEKNTDKVFNIFGK